MHIGSTFHKINCLFLFVLLCVHSGKAQTELKVMTFNLRYDEALFNEGKPKPTDWVNRKHLQVELIQKHQPDVIGMQEPHLHQIKYLEEELPEYGWFGVGRADGKEKGEFNPVFYKNEKLTVLKSGTFWLSEMPHKPSKSWDAGYLRICTWVLFQDKKSGNKFYVFNTHFDSKGKMARLKSAELINNKIGEMAGEKPVFVLGDFNFKPNSNPYIELTGRHLSDSHTQIENIAPGPEGTFNGFRYGANFRNRIDFIFVNKNVAVKEYGVIDFSKEGIYPSDHFPVLIKTHMQ